ncbi:phage protein Gp27 family protein [Pseudomonas sp. Irchel 3E13]|uniref:phage protein Gp27 family protein n=1 Tax=Pseudomonas sp. Irchel 3E13 TaxID=2008975 RepID=UPI000BA379A6|nr:phage protein Gp27 family protein [Pseudomonas sp. Irchel 3E13]
MPPRGIVESLSDQIKLEVDQKLRATAYGELISLANWLSAAHGVKISKSALGRYSQDLKAKDRASVLVARDMRDSLTDRQAIDLLVELGTLRIREHRILKRLEQIGYIDLGCPDTEASVEVPI